MSDCESIEFLHFLYVAWIPIGRKNGAIQTDKSSGYCVICNFLVKNEKEDFFSWLSIYLFFSFNPDEREIRWNKVWGPNTEALLVFLSCLWRGLTYSTFFAFFCPFLTFPVRFFPDGVNTNYTEMVDSVKTRKERGIKDKKSWKPKKGLSSLLF